MPVVTGIAVCDNPPEAMLELIRPVLRDFDVTEIDDGEVTRIEIREKE
jgi:hypothetical protein